MTHLTKFGLGLAVFLAACSHSAVAPLPAHNLDGRWSGWSPNYRFGVDAALREQEHIVVGEVTVGWCLNWDLAANKPKCFIPGTWDVATAFFANGTFFDPGLDLLWSGYYKIEWKFTADLVSDSLLHGKLEGGIGVGDTITLHKVKL